jgi:hypothetical protein
LEHYAEACVTQNFCHASNGDVFHFVQYHAGSVSESTFTGLGATSGTNPRSGTGTPGTSMPSMADFSPEMQEQMRKQMKDPVMKEVGAPLASCSSLAQFVNERERDR